MKDRAISHPSFRAKREISVTAITNLESRLQRSDIIQTLAAHQAKLPADIFLRLSPIEGSHLQI